MMVEKRTTEIIVLKFTIFTRFAVCWSSVFFRTFKIFKQSFKWAIGSKESCI